MKKGVYAASVMVFFFFFSCEHPAGFRSLPETDTSLFVDGNTVTFPQGTVARDIFNTVVYLFPDNEWHDVIGTWGAVPFTRIRHGTTAVKTHPNNTGYLYTHTVFLYGNGSARNIVYQRQTFNASQVTERANRPIQGDIIFTR